MGVVIDIAESPRPGSYFWRYMRELRNFLDTSSLNNDLKKGHPYFRTEDANEHEVLVKTTEENSYKLGKWKVEKYREN